MRNNFYLKSFVILLFLILFSPFIYSDFARDLDDSLRDNVQQIEDIKEKIESYSDRSTWSELRFRLMNRLLESNLVNSIDSFFNQISFLFLLLFAEHYSISLLLFLVILLWFYFFILIGKLLVSLEYFNDFIIPYFISFVLVVSLSWARLFNFLSGLIINLFNSFDSFLIRIFLFFGLFILLYFIYSFILALSNSFVSQRKKKYEREYESDRKKLSYLLKGLFSSNNSY